MPPGCILILDDDPLVTRALSRGLTSRGLVVHTSNRSIGFLSLVLRHRPSLVVVDVAMPGLDGTQVANLIRAERELEHTQLILYAGVPDDDLAMRAAACDADGWVPKSTPIDSVLNMFARWAKRTHRPAPRSYPRIGVVRKAS